MTTTTPTSRPAAPPRRRWFDRQRPLPTEAGQHRTSAFIYGNLLVLAALVPLTPEQVAERGALVVVGVTISTFLAHMFASMVTAGWTWADLRRNARDSAPILTSGAMPTVVLAAVLVGFPTIAALVLAQLVLVIRIALIGVVAARLRNESASRPTFLVGLGIAASAVLTVLIKLMIASPWHP